ncbi:DNA repair endonuclease XPF [Nilaparvata lugens]|uniref:DNA repair endonuclease XPF n=1 Tax=Nilaparvata lugens TaxID=108931 RepID=UPI00193DFC5B|nr:DNA repair endonuclease XPF [Nilaparvata lugens]XP_039287621.1 DNA repair endonuclease XPF [Nilaparvata lugens]
MIEYENQMFLDVLYEDGLLISAKGLRVETVIMNLLKVYCDPGNLVVVMGATPQEEQFFISELEKQEVTPLPKVLTYDHITYAERESVYLGGGVMFVSATVIVIDLLKKRIPIPKITGFIVMRAHRILESCQEAFAIRLYRQGNKTGFIKAFSTSPHSFTVGFAQVERIMRTLFVKNLYLWPRFHATVNTCMEKKKPAVVEFHLELTTCMSHIQTSVLDLVHFCIKEIKRLNPSLDTEDITVENALSKTFHKMLQMQLDPVWHQLSGKTKQLVSDLKTIRHIIQSLFQQDCVSFYSYLNKLRDPDYVMRSSGWLLLDSFESMYVAAKKRIYNAKNEVDLEPNPKWEALSAILKEIYKNSKDTSHTVLVLVHESSTVTQLRNYLTTGSSKLLSQMYAKLIATKSKSKFTATKSGTSEAEADSEENADEEEMLTTVTLTQTMTQIDDQSKEDGDVDMEATFTQCTQEQLVGKHEPVIVLQQFKQDGDTLSLPNSLKLLHPLYIVLYDVDVTAIRQIECFQAADTVYQITVYFLIHGESVEEQAYLTSLRREKEAFEFLIKEKSSMVVHADQDGKSEDCAELNRDMGVSASATNSANTRKGGATVQPTVMPKVIVDIREFRSELPTLLHRRGINIEPISLLVGDYILSPEMCVERKSISDLIGSLNNGRLYTQALNMTRYYQKPILLIEFDQNKPFALQGRYYLSNDKSSNDITNKLQLLTLQFPKLRLVWSPNPYATAQLFHELKEGKEEPDSSVAAAIGVEGVTVDDDYRLEKYNSQIQDFVTQLPGIDSKNLYSLLDKGESLDNLIKLSQQELNAILRNSYSAESLYNALHTEVDSLPDDETIIPARGAAFSRGRFGRRGRGRFITKKKT